MSSPLDAYRSFPEITIPAGGALFEEGTRTGRLYVLIEGEVAVMRGGEEILKASEPGAVFGEMSILLDRPHGATVVAHRDTRAFRIEDGAKVMWSRPDIMFHIARTLAFRVDLLNGYLLDIKHQFADRGDHLSMVDVILESLCLQQSHSVNLGSDRDPIP